jgi:hypothetical protein
MLPTYTGESMKPVFPINARWTISQQTQLKVSKHSTPADAKNGRVTEWICVKNKAIAYDEDFFQKCRERERGKEPD